MNASTIESIVAALARLDAAAADLQVNAGKNIHLSPAEAVKFANKIRLETGIVRSEFHANSRPRNRGGKPSAAGSE